MIFQKLQIILIIGLFLFFCQVNISAVSDDIDVIQQVTGALCGNGVCESNLGENYMNCPEDCTRRIGVLPDTTPPVIYDFLISQITFNSAEILWKTNEPALCQFFWGQTEEYKEGSVSEDNFYFEHSTKLINLLPETTYHFKVSCRDASHNKSETKDQKFTTLAPPDVTPPANVTNFEAIPGDSQITLKWQNPSEGDFDKVVIIRSDKFYPQDLREGKIIYDGKGNSFLDTGLNNGTRYYYTIFAYDIVGNSSSGAVASAIPFKGIPPEIPPEIPPVEVPLEISELTIEDFHFFQNGQEVYFKEGKLELSAEGNLTINIPYEKVPEVLKTIMVTLEKDGKFFSFLLRINQDKTFYEAIIVVPEPGIYPFTLTILDYKNQTLKKIYGQIEIKGKIQALPIAWHKRILTWPYIIYILILLIPLMFLIFLFFAKRRKKEDKEDKVERREGYGFYNQT